MNLKDLLIKHEGMVLHAYADSRGYLTLGVGRLIDQRGGGITEEEALYLLSHDIEKAVAGAKAVCPSYDKLSDDRKAVIASMVFNMGQGGVAGFKHMLAAIADEDWQTAAHEMLDSAWARQVGHRAFELAQMMANG